MQYIEFQNKFNQYRVFSIKDIEKQYPEFNKMNLISWQKKKYIAKIRNGLYRFNEKLTNETELYYIANRIYSPSYISFETALNYYGIIPETVFQIISVSTLKTQNFTNELGLFKYKNLKADCFFGYRFVSNGNFTFKIADIEKSLLDYFYFSGIPVTFSYIESLRLNRNILKEKLDYSKLEKYAQLYNTKQLIRNTEILKSYLND